MFFFFFSSRTNATETGQVMDGSASFESFCPFSCCRLSCVGSTQHRARGDCDRTTGEGDGLCWREGGGGEGGVSIIRHFRGNYPIDSIVCFFNDPARYGEQVGCCEVTPPPRPRERKSKCQHRLRQIKGLVYTRQRNLTTRQVIFTFNTLQSEK